MNSDRLRSLFRPLLSGWRVGISRFGPGGFSLILFLLATAIGCGIYLIVGESPWEHGIPEKLGKKEPLSIGDTIAAGLWLAAVINLGIAILLLALARWWARPLPEMAVPTSDSPKSGGGLVLGARWFWLFTLLAVLAAGWLRGPHLYHSFWNDEEQAFRKFTWGEYRPASASKPKKGHDGQPLPTDPDALVFVPTGWDRALFYSVNGNNHVVHTIAAKLWHAIWRAIEKPEPETFRESVIRLEPFLSGLLAIIALASWLRMIGFPVVGVVAAWVIALHPWALRYGAEARGYSAMLLYILLTLLCLTLALHTRRWRWWLGFGLYQCLYLLCFAGAVYLAVAMNALAFLVLARRRDVHSLWRWFVSCTLGAMLFLQMMTATVLRIWNWIQAPHVEPFPMNMEYFRDFWGHLAIGAPWAGPSPELHVGVDVTQLAAASSLWSVGIKIILPLLLIAGVIIGCLRSQMARMFFGILALCAGLIFLHNTRSELAFYSWYALYFVLWFAVALGFIAEGAASAAGKLKPANASLRNGIGLASAAVVIGFYGWISHASAERIRLHDRHPMRQAVVEVRGEAPAIATTHAALLTGAVGSGANQLRTYDPRVQWIKTIDDLDALIAESRSLQKPLVLYVCGPQQLARTYPDLAARLMDTTTFESGTYLPGLEEFWSFRILKLRPSDPTPNAAPQ